MHPTLRRKAWQPRPVLLLPSSPSQHPLPGRVTTLPVSQGKGWGCTGKDSRDRGAWPPPQPSPRLAEWPWPPGAGSERWWGRDLPPGPRGPAISVRSSFQQGLSNRSDKCPSGGRLTLSGVCHRPGVMAHVSAGDKRPPASSAWDPPAWAADGPEPVGAAGGVGGARVPLCRRVRARTGSQGPRSAARAAGPGLGLRARLSQAWDSGQPLWGPGLRASISELGAALPHVPLTLRQL